MKDIFFGILVFVSLWGIVGGILHIANTKNQKLATAPCEDFAGYRFQNIPARCFSYFITPVTADIRIP